MTIFVLQMNQIYLIGIAGPSASGKTSFLNQLRHNFSPEEVCIISQDDYYLPIHEQKSDEFGIVNYDLPGSIDDQRFLNDLRLLSQNKVVEIKEYVFNNPNKAPEVKLLSPAPVVVVEGLFIFYFEEIMRLLNLKLFIDARDDIKMRRRMQRDESERAIPEDVILHQWHHHVYPAYKRFLLPYRDEADMILTNNFSFQKSFEVIAHHIRAVLER